MKRKRGDLPGRYVPAHLRKAPNRPSEYVSVSAYQERIEPPPSPVEPAPLQGQLELPEREGAKRGDDEEEDRASCDGFSK